MNQLYKTIYPSPVGQLLILCDTKYLRKLCPIDDADEYLSVPEEKTEPICLTIHWLDAYFAGLNPPICDIPILVNGTTFQQKCWQLLCKIPYGTTCTYKDIAEEIAKTTPSGRMSCQAVGQAISKNPIAIMIPCHRVIGSDGSLTGYSGGLKLKKSLLLHENAMKAAL